MGLEAFQGMQQVRVFEGRQHRRFLEKQIAAVPKQFFVGRIDDFDLETAFGAARQGGGEKLLEDDLVFGVEIPGMICKHQGLGNFEDAPDGVASVQHSQVWQNHSENYALR